MHSGFSNEKPPKLLPVLESMEIMTSEAKTLTMIKFNYKIYKLHLLNNQRDLYLSIKPCGEKVCLYMCYQPFPTV